MMTYAILCKPDNKPDWAREAEGVMFQAPSVVCARQMSVAVMQALYSMYFATKPPKVKKDDLFNIDRALNIDICWWDVMLVNDPIEQKSPFQPLHPGERPHTH